MPEWSILGKPRLQCMMQKSPIDELAPFCKATAIQWMRQPASTVADSGFPLTYYYQPQRSCGQGNVFTGVCLSTVGCLPQCMLGCQTPRTRQGEPLQTTQIPQTRENPPRPGRTPLDQGEPPGSGRENPPGPGRTPPDQGETPPDQGDPPQTRENPPDQGEPPGPGSIRSTSGRYASYWNAFLFGIIFAKNGNKRNWTERGRVSLALPLDPPMLMSSLLPGECLIWNWSRGGMKAGLCIIWLEAWV